MLDLLHIMDYDYHGGWEEFTGKTSQELQIKSKNLIEWQTILNDIMFV